MVLSHLKMVEQRRKTDDERHQALSLVLYLSCVRFPVAAGVVCRLACELRWLFLLLVLHILILSFILRLLTHVP